MFERKNQNVLSKHYSKLIEHDPATLADDDDDFIVLKRADHDLPGDLAPLDDSDLSRRKLKLSRVKQMIIKNGVATKTIFDDEGNAHNVYEMADPDAWYEAKGGLAGAKQEGQMFAAQEGTKMRVADVVDREEAKAKKQEKKRKRKEKEKAVRLLSLDPASVSVEEIALLKSCVFFSVTSSLWGRSSRPHLTTMAMFRLSSTYPSRHLTKTNLTHPRLPSVANSTLRLFHCNLRIRAWTTKRNWHCDC